MRLLASQVAEAIGATLVGPEVEFDGASFDSRTTSAGELFVPLVADRDGHDYIVDALERGAAAYFTSGPIVGGSAIVVDDTAAALMSLAAWARRRMDVPVVGVTGSVGKTSTKDLIAASLGATRSVTANVRSFNNEQGLPVTILGAPERVGALVVEMGMRGFGEIARLCEVALPTIGVVTSVASSHTERVGGIDGVAIAKRELVEALGESGVAVLNADDERVAAMGRHARASVMTYGLAGEVRISEIELDDLARPAFHIDSPWGAGDVQLAVSGEHMASNAAAAIAVAGVIEGRIDPALEALATASVSGMRMEVSRAPSGAVIVNDAYNANPDSMRAALEALANIAASRRVAVLGEMAELDDPAVGHQRVMNDAIERGIEVIAVGTDLYGVRPVADPINALGEIGDGDAVLVKASRVAGLERVAQALLRI
jgi:UDP-N-acetylmuramoyl-tripeptide--D-alanyl-D-alanine ligase